jgi:hypothetical protein
MAAGTLRIYNAGVFEETGQPPVTWGSMVTPVKAVTVTPLLLVRPQIVTLAIGEMFTLWAYDADRPDFSSVQVWLPDQSGNIDIGIGYAPASSLSDTPRWRTLKAGCHDRFSLSEDELLTNAVAADDYGDNAGYPLIWSDAGTVAGKIVKIAVMNPAIATAAVRVAYTVIGGA